MRPCVRWETQGRIGQRAVLSKRRGTASSFSLRFATLLHTLLPATGGDHQNAQGSHRTNARKDDEVPLER